MRGKRYGNWRNLKITAKCSLGVLENRRIKLGIENARGWEVLCKPVHRPQRGVLWPYMQPEGCSYSGVWGQVQSKQKAIPFLWEPSGLLVKSQPAEGLGNALCYILSLNPTEQNIEGEVATNKQHFLVQQSVIPISLFCYWLLDVCGYLSACMSVHHIHA